MQHGANENLSPEALMANRADLLANVKRHTLDDAYYRSLTPNLSHIKVPLLSVGNWGGVGLHLRGNIEGYIGAASEYKWLRIHTGNHFTPFYSDEGRALQERFFDYWLKGHENGLLDDARLQLAIRRGSGFTWRCEDEWPLARTRWTLFYLDAATCSMSEHSPGTAAYTSYEVPKGSATFVTAPFTQDTEVTGPLALRLWISSSAEEMDLFVTIRNIDAHGNDVSCVGSNNEAIPVTKGWLRTSHRKRDHERSSAYRPYHSHDEIQKLSPEEIVAVDVEIWPTSMVFEVGHRLALDIEAHDGIGSGMYHHNDPDDRDLSLLTGTNTIHTGGEYLSSLLLPIIPQSILE